ncbi:hypothetical protein HK097_001932 [Rhizophlyctis rosea]|uniref:Uncharacterized protein n=1 Tax=Rhizophlyctis rosea TaxID=64517 RepID=A0AAD5SKG2_9FUNG|nr:hypothetical protein HK097_001932 [Rhizophlyctis rosea]
MPTMDYFGSQAGMQSRGMGPLAHPTLNDPSGMNAGMMGLSGYPDPLTVRPSLGLPQPMGRGNFPLQSDMRSSVPPPFYDQFAPDGILAQLPVQPLSHPPASAPMMPYAAAAASMYKSPSGYADMDVDIDPSLYPRRRDTPTASPSIASSSSMSPGRRGSDPQGDASRRPHDRPGAEAAAPAEPVAPVSKPRKKPILEEDAVCSRCNRFLGVLLLHTPNAATSPIQSPATQPYTVGIVCQTCDPTACAAAVVQSNQVGGLVPGSKKRGAGGRENDCVACEVCKRVAGVGGVRVIEGWKESRDTPRHGVRSGSGDRFGQTPILGDGEPDFGVEFVCESCRSKYALCTECGGGGKYRTGKWRPVGLFLPGRRTCRLPHVRIGSSPITFRSYCLPESLGSNPTERASILQDIERHVPAMYYHRLAVPEVMEIPPPNGLSTWENLEERVRIRCERLRELILEDSVERKFGLRRYFGGAWVERVNRHARKERKERKGTSSKSAGKGTSKAKESDDGGGPNRGGGGRSRSTKKGSDGDVKASFSDSPLLPPPISTNTPGQDPLVMVGMLTLLWCRPGGIVWITAFQGLNTEFSASGVMFRLCRRMVETVIAEYRKEEQRAKDEGVTIPDCKECTLNMDTNPNPKYAPPIHSIGLPVFEEFASLPGVSHTLRRLGFLPMDEYIRQHPELDREIFDRAVRDPEGVYGGKTDYRRSFFLAGTLPNRSLFCK